MKKYKQKFLRVLLIIALVISSITTVPAFSNAETASASAQAKNIIAYFPNWGIYNVAHKSMTVSMLPWDKITVVNHAFFEVDSSFRLASIDTFADFDKSMEHSEGWETGQLRGHFGEYKYYKSIYPNVKILISIGGWTRGNNFHSMAKTAEGRAVFINSLIEFLDKYPFIDGFDLDWEYPGIDRKPDPNDEYDKGCPGGPEDKENFTFLLKEIREAYDNTGHSDKMLTIAASGGYDKLELIEPDKFQQYLDWINVMTYDFHGAWETTTGHHAGLYANPEDTAATSPVDIKGRYNTDAAVRNFTQIYGVPAAKLNVGTPYYSRGWKGVTGGINGMYGTAAGAATGSWDNPNSPGGQYPYFTLKQMENTGGYIKYRDDTYAKTPWLYNKSTGILLSYEDMTSLSARCDFINNNGYGGLIIWEITGDTDNFEMTGLAHDKLISSNPTAAAPVFSPAGGRYTGTQTVTITSATVGAVIRYTMDGTEPTVNSPVYSTSTPLTVQTTTTLKAKAFLNGLADSATSTAVYTILSEDTTAEPVFSPAGGTYTESQEVTLTCTTENAVIRYTTNSSEPTASSPVYTGPVRVDSTTTIKAKAFKEGKTASATVTAIYTIENGQGQPGITPWAPNISYQKGDIVSYSGRNYECIQSHTSLTGWEPVNVPALWKEYAGSVTPVDKVATPEFNPAGGVYSKEVNITIQCATTGAAIRYTTDGTEPTESSRIYSAPIGVDSTTTIKTKAYKNGMTASATATAAYTIEEGTEQPEVTPWVPNTSYRQGDIVSYNGKNYECTQSHTSLTGWEPVNVPALWKEYTGSVTPADKVLAPEFNPTGGVYSEAVNVTLQCTTEGAVIRYTTNGTEPTAASQVYSGQIRINSITTIKAKAYKEGMTASDTAAATYTIGQGPVAELSEHILTGYWQNFDNGATCLKISNVPASYNLIAVAFADAAAQTGAVTFTLDSTLSSRLGGYTKEEFIADIAAAKLKGQKVIISIGGENGSVQVNSTAAAKNFADSVYGLMLEYGFDGVDIDLENGINPAYMASALRQLYEKTGPGLLITLAPQTIDMQNVNSGYFKLALDIKDILTVVNTQYYNSGSMLGQDGKVYSQGTIDFITALAAIQLENGLKPEQVGLGLPASQRGAGSGYVDPSVVNSAINILAKGASGGSYIPPRSYPSLRGAMTWSINWDALNNYNFANSVAPTLADLSSNN
ncbi:MAG: glycosyl hydrolase family 18 protein [Anaerocolumna sp.]